MNVRSNNLSVRERKMMSMKLVGTIFVLLQLQLQLLLYSNNYGVASAGCIDMERRALLQLKASLVENDINDLLPSWDNKSYDCCEWKRVGCSNQTGHVEMLHLYGDRFGRFRGDINASLLELRQLKYLNLSYNRFSNSKFPELFGSLSNLRFLDLRASFNGGRFPNDISRLSNLQYLDLSYNILKGTIPHQFGNLSHLQYLDLSWNDLVGTIPHQLGSLSNLQYLDLGWNLLSDKNDVGGEWLSNLTLLTHLDLTYMQNLNSSRLWLQTIAMLPNIQILYLSDCHLSDLSPFHPIFNFSSSLKILDLSRNAFTSFKIFEWVFNVASNLTELDLSDNLLQGSIHCDFGNTVGKSLERLDLSGNFLQILESFSHICTLHSLRVDENNLNEDISTILLKLSGCARHSLQDLSLSGNQISGSFPNLSTFPSLIAIDLSYNLISGKVTDGDIFFPSKLESLMFANNSLEGGIPKSFGNLCSLRSLDMSSNKLSEDLSVIIHDLSVGCAKYSIQELYLDSNQIIGTLPDMSVFSSLKTLILSHNLLYGKIMQNSSFPYQLESLELDSNNLEGVITDSHFGNMSMLKNLNLNSNSLALIFSENWVPPFQLFSIYLRSCILGPSFPIWLQGQKYLQALDISDAKITDLVPVWFWTQSTNLFFMNISNNNLSGTIPNLSVRFSEGFQAILNSNQFEGSIPPFFRSAILLEMSKNKFSKIDLFLCTNTMVDNLSILDISNNQLSSRLPDCWGHLKALEFIDLSDNSLSGEIPSSMGSLLQLKVLILRNNSFTGKLPFSLKNCTNLGMLDLGENKFSGPIPYWLGQQLQMLSLRRNQFYGNLPHSLCYLTNIQLLDLSENNISGPIFKCLKNFLKMSQNVLFTTFNKSHLFYRTRFGFSFFYDSYDLTPLLMWKGEERLFKNNKLILRSIDLSSNQLIGNIPEEIGNLVELVSLNLSSNNLSGEITSKIGKLKLLEFLDLSRNQFSGLIPPSLAQIDRLSMLNLSYNNLFGRIPIGTQLQGFDPSSYEGNVGLCGKPLVIKCPGDEKVTPQKPETPKESSLEDKKSIYLSVTLGFITGFWGLWGSLLFIQTWRHAYVLFLNNITDTMYVFMVLNATKFQRWLRALLEKFV
ncbi:receptor-like protein EIX2 isoform X1 [Cicer arietinum]|uniref:Receptor-like protein EIX2 isoform X1 n=1 Tax=Cicer arietinum TaxID=3827 RepID=A0A1S2XMV3_CICAR|nr:receptor-like protein EIX2 isoform X1 [Cicer arietinum]